MTRYVQRRPNKWFDYTYGMKIACCDCGLVHELDIEISHTEEVQIRMRRNKRATAAIRRGKRVKRSIQTLNEVTK